MDYQECSKHASTEEGAKPLKNPELVKRTSKDINRGLYPKSDGKRPRNLQSKAGYTSLSDTIHNNTANSSTQSCHQRCFNASSPKRKLPDDFCSMTKLKISSPSKPLDSQDSAVDIRNSERPSSNKCFRSEDVLKSVKRDLKDQFNIQQSRNAPSTSTNVQEFDSLDDDLMISASQEAEKQCSTSSSVMDENLQAFEDDTFFDNLSSAVLDDIEKGDYLPNTFGLLGGSSNYDVDEPDEASVEYFERLPDEVLEVIFSYLSITVCCNISTVCRRWSRIILSEKFLPWKKLYERYKISEDSGVLAVEAIYKNHSFKSSGSCFLNLIRFMSEFQPVYKSCSVDYMKSHPMFNLSCDLLAERAPELILQGEPNLWSLLATLVILSRNTRDISQAIKFSLQSYYEHSVLIECFYCIATVLLMLHNKHRISYGLHYRLYYALYHYETGSSLAYTSSRMAIKLSTNTQSVMPQSSYVMTQEQVAIVGYKLRPREIVKIVAFAGTGKTSTLINYTLRNPNMKFLYVAFNKSVQEQAMKLFPGNVECRTTHSLAYKDVGYKYKKKLTPDLKVFHVACMLQPNSYSWNRANLALYVRAQLVTKTIKNFLASDDDCIMLMHVPLTEKENGQAGTERRINPERRKKLGLDAKNIWNRMTKPHDLEATVTHDVYLKLYQLSKPRLPAVDCILIDEAQDLTPAQQDILLSQDCAKILVGDPHQQIYSFRGATNALQNIPATKIFHLTQSFRFGPEIAYIANCVLRAFKSVKRKNIIGVETLGSVLGEEVGQVAVICRTNLSLFNEAAKLTRENENVTIGLVGGVKSYRMDQLLDIYRLLLPQSERQKPENTIKNKFISKFESISELERYAENVDDMDLQGRIMIVRQNHNNIPEYVDRIRARALDDISLAEVVFTTAHKAKGLEFDTVKVTCDFASAPDEGILMGFNGVQHPISNVKIHVDELNLLYVALTRAKKRLILTEPILKMLSKLNERFSYPVSTKAVINNDVATGAKCYLCNSVISTNTVLLFERLKINLGFSNLKSRPAGILCPYCAAEENVGFTSLVCELQKV